MVGKNRIGYAAIIISVFALAGIAWEKFNKSDYKYLNIKKLYDAFDMKKEYEGRFKSIQIGRQKVIDSMEMQLKVLSQEIELSKEKDKSLIAKFQIHRDEYFRKKRENEEDNAATIKDFDEKILTQLNQYIEDYGKSHSYEYIFSYGNGGELVYGIQKNNITEDVLRFINEKYKGVK